MKDHLQRYKILLGYDGSACWGWQAQPAHRTVQGELERVLKELTGETQRIQCSGRTDRGVHAREQVAHFDLAKPVVLRKLLLGFNALLQEDIRVFSIRKARPEFHARYDAAGKEYRYFIWNGPVMPPWLRHYRTLVRAPLDVRAMAQAAMRLVGRHDFSAFSANPNREIDGAVRHLRALSVRRRGREITVTARGDGFLYKMVRSLAGFLIRVGAGELPPEAARVILDSKSRTARVPTAPPQGLFLWKVAYSKKGAS
ncbi:MAG TPA: tRNA pseudouridine(38-40) synthase TruA [Kiritimatiellia bacterium]|nr:tRNA pseudouridine(38-40) synthase TruA [Kiritimatiellia bacterium]HSA17182.1 tRNA pseudouridine(38-40) synthase TruA [Kiritimatiellia bacterium]